MTLRISNISLSCSWLVLVWERSSSMTLWLKSMDRPICKHGNDFLDSLLPVWLLILEHIQAWHHSIPYSFRDCSPGRSTRLQRRTCEPLCAGTTPVLMSYYIGHCWPPPNTQVDRSLVLSKGKAAVAKLLIELQVRKSTADAKGSREFYNNLTRPIPGWEGEIRDIVLRKKLVRFWYLMFSSSIFILFFF